MVRQDSLLLYKFMCQAIVGTEKTVRTKRLMNTVKDNLSSYELRTVITSGSFGEGLELAGSDLDIMLVEKHFIVHEDTENAKVDPEKINLVMETNNTKPGFVHLRWVNKELNSLYRVMCIQNGKSLYISSELLKYCFLKGRTPRSFKKIHGPCLSDENESIDMALSFHNAMWLKSQENWISRRNTPWPSSDVISKIIDHGVLFVPIGPKESGNEALGWRISFSVAEKLLVYSFLHTQLLCYALMKILLKDLINSNNICKNLLCSYFIKTIIFWVSEETPVAEWKPENLIPCFIKCFRRLVYYVEYSMCPHYFIPKINMFENKIEGQSRQLLLEHLKTLFSFGWRCLYLSKQIRHFPIVVTAQLSKTEIQARQFQQLLTSQITMNEFHSLGDLRCYRSCIRQLNTTKSSLIRSIYLRYLSVVCSRVIQKTVASTFNFNKTIYYQYRKNQSYLLQNVNHDAVSGWLMLAAFFNKFKQYTKAIYILHYALKKCTPEKVYSENGKCVSQQQMNLLTSATLRRLGIMRVMKHLNVRLAFFVPNSTLIPEELALDVSQCSCSLPPVVFVHFLGFLCHYHLNDRQQCYKSIKDLQRTIDKKFFIAGRGEKAQGYNVLGIALQLVGQNDLSAQYFSKAAECDAYFDSRTQRLKIMHTQMM